MGSLPILKKQMIGVKGRLSFNKLSMSNIIASTYLGPREVLMYLRLCAKVRSKHHDLCKRNEQS